MFLSPRGYQKTEGGMPRFLENWLNFKNKEVDLGRDKLGLICYGSELFHKNVSKYLTRYMADLVPCVLKMKEALKNKEREKITHDLWIKILTETLDSLPENKTIFMPDVVKLIPGVKKNTRSVMCEMKHRETVYSQRELELGIFYAKLQTLFRTGPPSSLIVRRVPPPSLFE